MVVTLSAALSEASLGFIAESSTLSSYGDRLMVQIPLEPTKW